MITSIPNLHASTVSRAKGSGKVIISRRKDTVNSGLFSFKLAVKFDSVIDNYPKGSLEITTDLTDSLKGVFTATSIEMINSFGKHNPSIFLTGRCDVKSSEQLEIPKGCKYWVILSGHKKANDNGGSPDIIGFEVHDRNGNLIAYGTGPVISGDIVVLPS
jgi:hypothetical protein